MKRVGTIIIFLSVILNYGQAAAIDSGGMVISEIQAGSADNSRQEFIELFNQSNELVNFETEDWYVQIVSGSTTDWSKPYRSIKLTGFLQPFNHYLIGVSYNETVNGLTSNVLYPEQADVRFSPALSSTSDRVRIVRVTPVSPEIVIDQIEWGPTSMTSLDNRTIFPVSKALAPGISLARTQTDTEEYVDTNDDKIDFTENKDPSPLTTTSDQLPLPAESIPTEPPVINEPEETSPDQPSNISSLEISELLPNPASPYLDSNDEFIEIHNPSDSSVNLKGFSLQTGTVTIKMFHISSDVIIEPYSYASFFSKDTKLSLSNTASQARIIGPLGEVVAETDAYSKALDGQAWALIDQKWQWTTKPTPDSPNEYVAPLIGLTTAKAVKTAIKTTVPKVAKTKVAKTTTKKAKQAKPKTTKAKTTKTALTTLAANTVESPKTVIHSAVLAIVVALAVVYGAYEYRHDLANKFNKLKGYRNNRGQHR